MLTELSITVRNNRIDAEAVKKDLIDNRGYSAGNITIEQVPTLKYNARDQQTGGSADLLGGKHVVIGRK